MCVVCIMLMRVDKKLFVVCLKENFFSTMRAMLNCHKHEGERGGKGQA